MLVINDSDLYIIKFSTENIENSGSRSFSYNLKTLQLSDLEKSLPYFDAVDGDYGICFNSENIYMWDTNIANKKLSVWEGLPCDDSPSLLEYYPSQVL
jgi:hypothetical protein